jgi:hypothetical protein
MVKGEAVVAGADGIAVFDALHRRGTVIRPHCPALQTHNRAARLRPR